MKIETWGPAIALLCLVAVAAGGQLLQQAQNQAPRVQSQQEPAHRVGGGSETDEHANPQRQPSGSPENADASKHTENSEILGVKRGEWLLFIATLGLWWATMRLAKDARRSGERQLRLTRGMALNQQAQTRESNQIAKDAADVAKKSANVAEKAMLGLERPIPMVDLAEVSIRFTPEGFEATTFLADTRIKPIVVNLGRQPCIIREYCFWYSQNESDFWERCPPRLVEVFDYVSVGEPWHQNTYVVCQGNGYRRQDHFDRHASLIELDSSRALKFNGYVVYDDLIDTRRRRDFVWEFLGDSIFRLISLKEQHVAARMS